MRVPELLKEILSVQPTDGIYFEYDRATHGANWHAICRSNGTETATDTSTAVTTNLVNLKAIVNAGGTSVEFFIDGTSVATITTNIPTGTSRIMSSLAAQFVKTAGTSTRRVYYDAARYDFYPTTPR